MTTINAQALRETIRRILAECDGCSLDNQNDRADVTVALMHAIENFLLGYEIEAI